MFRSSKFSSLSMAPKRLVTAAAAKAPGNLSKIVSETSGDGVKLTCVTVPSISSGLSRVVAAFKAGSRYEINSSDRGLSHLIRRSFGLSTDNFTSINMTRHLEQMGARVQVTGTREHMIYTVDVAPNLASRAGYLLAHMATAPAYYDWELKDITYKLMRYDIDLIQRRDMNNLCVDLIHEAAFGNHPDGTRLGRSLYSTHDRLGSYTYQQITNFLKKTVAPGNCAITLMNIGSKHNHMDPSKALDEIKSGLDFHPPNKENLVAKHDFVGTDIRRDISTSSSTHAMLAYHVKGGRKNLASHLALTVAAKALQGGVHNISYADAASRSSRLAKTAEKTGFEDYLTQCGSIYHSYSDHGLFGFSVIGSCGRATGARVAEASKALSELAKSGLTADEVQRGKAVLKSTIGFDSERMRHEAVDITLQVLESGSLKTLEQQIQEIDKLTPEVVNQALKEVLSSGKVALSVVGANTALTPPLSVLKN